METYNKIKWDANHILNKSIRKQLLPLQMLHSEITQNEIHSCWSILIKKGNDEIHNAWQLLWKSDFSDMGEFFTLQIPAITIYRSWKNIPYWINKNYIIKNNKKICYYNIPCAFDIETTSFIPVNRILEKKKKAIMYLWQLGIQQLRVYW